ncbi:MAG TPA: ATP-binding cassette domain-containing protein [Solirubrobacteraceae bacterium]|jgi:ABC-2 type transport system ATP-binding protein
MTVETTHPDTAPTAATRPIVASKLSKRYREVLAVDGVDIDLPGGVVGGFVGPNGAGKTTTIQLLLGLVRPTGGTASVLGESIAHPERYLRRVGALIEAPSFYPALSGRRNLEVLTRLGRLDRSRIDEVLALVELTERADHRVKTYSLGMKQRLGVAAALLPDPELVILDEPTNGLDPAGIREMRSVMRGLADRGITVLVSSHLLREIEAICDHLMMIDHGRIVFQGPIGGLLDAQHTGVIATPEHTGDLEKLAALCTAAGKPAHIDGDVLRVSAGEDWAAELNRQAFAAGITLRGLEVTRATLEEAFFAITDADAEAEDAMEGRDT